MEPSSSGPGAVRLLHDDDRERYEAFDGDEVVGVLYYGDEPSGATARRDLRSTVVAPERNGEGIGSALVRFALDDVRSRGLRVRATCWFASGWIDRHPEYAELRDGEDDPREERNETP